MSAKKVNDVIGAAFADLGVEDNSPKKEVSTKKAEGDYMRVTSSLPLDIVEKINLLAVRRKMAGVGGGISGIVKDALIEYLDKNF